MSEDANPFRSRLSLLIPINNLQPRQQEQLLASGEILDVRKKEFVFRQGERDGWSYYLLAGELDMIAGDQLIKKVIGGEGASFQPLAQLQPRQMSARAVTNVQVLRVDRRLLDQLLSTAQEAAVAPAIEVTEYEADGTIDWLTVLLQSELFSRIPTANTQRLPGFGTLDLYARGLIDSPWNDFALDNIDITAFDSDGTIFADGLEGASDVGAR